MEWYQGYNLSLRSKGIKEIINRDEKKGKLKGDPQQILNPETSTVDMRATSLPSDLLWGQEANEVFLSKFFRSTSWECQISERKELEFPF